jgi:hypothetical protein
MRMWLKCRLYALKYSKRMPYNTDVGIKYLAVTAAWLRAMKGWGLLSPWDWNELIMAVPSCVFWLCVSKKKMVVAAVGALRPIKQVASYVSKPLYLPIHLDDSCSLMYLVSRTCTTVATYLTLSMQLMKYLAYKEWIRISTYLAFQMNRLNVFRELLRV